VKQSVRAARGWRDRAPPRGTSANLAGDDESGPCGGDVTSWRDPAVRPTGGSLRRPTSPQRGASGPVECLRFVERVCNAAPDSLSNQRLAGHADCTACEGTVEPITLTVVAVVGLGVLVWAVNLGRNRSFTKEVAVFHASRWTKGNRIWPTQVAVFPNRVVRYTPGLFGHFEETIGIEQVASVSVDSSLIFGDVIIETTGGSQPIRCHGHRRADAEAIRSAITEAQDVHS
jgi:hypothetical protein